MMWAKITLLLGLTVSAIHTVHSPPKPYILIQGDSRSDPKGDCCGGPTNTWPYILTEISPFFRDATIVNLAGDGFTTLDLLRQLDTGVVIKPKGIPAFALVWVGVNDISAGATGEQIYDHEKEIWAKDRALGYKIVAFTIGPFCTFQEAMARGAEANRLIEADHKGYDYLARPDANMLDCHAYNLGVSDMKDGAHPNSTGEAIIAQTVWQLFVRNHLAN